MPRSNPAGARLPANYLTILALVNEHARGCHLTREAVHELARKIQPGIGATTVYRALVRLRDLGKIAEVTVPGAAQAFYERVSEPHAHLRCESCATIRDVDYHLSPAIIAMIEHKHNVSVAASSVSLRGLCAACSAHRSTKEFNTTL